MAVDETLLRQALADRYEVEARVGEGGGAAVFRARDLKHPREVALKVLHPEVAQAVGTARFLAEIATTARLNHPHILPLIDSGEADGFLYYVMPFEGESLRDTLSREQQLPFDVAIRYASEVGEALEYAHRHGSVHRDIKPENILILEGHAIVADFGIAKSLEPVDPVAATTTGTAVGTPLYMSPEQWSGGRVDGRSDLYSLACTLYEMLGGQPPFLGSSAQIIAHQHQSVEPHPVTALRPSVPEPVAHAIQRALSKTPADRQPNIAAFVAELHAATTVPDASHQPTVQVVKPGTLSRIPRAVWVAGAVLVAAGIAKVLVPIPLPWPVPSPPHGLSNTIAVLPLENLAGKPDQDYFAEGMTDELVTCLSKISSLTVISNSASSTYRGTKKPLATIAHELGVRFVLEGSVARDLGKVRIGTRLIEARTGRNLWAESYERGFQDVFSLQSDVALAVASQIQARLTGAERVALAAPLKVAPEAHELYLKARFSMENTTQAGAQKSIQLLKQALQEDPNYALAYAEIGNDYYFMSGWYLPSREAMPLARQYAEKALGIDPGLAEGMTIRGLVTAFYDWRFDEGREQLAAAVVRNPGSMLAHQYYAEMLIMAGRFRDARAEFARARELDPISQQLHWYSIWPAFYERQYAEAVAELNTLRAEDESFWPTYSLLGEAYEQLGDLKLARSTLERARALGGNPWVTAALARVEARTGRTAEARALLRQLEAQSETTYVQPYALATVHAYLGDSDQAFRVLETCFRDRSEDLAMLPIDPRVDILRRDARFAALLARLHGSAPKSSASDTAEREGRALPAEPPQRRRGRRRVR